MLQKPNPIIQRTQSGPKKKYIILQEDLFQVIYCGCIGERRRNRDMET